MKKSIVLCLAAAALGACSCTTEPAELEPEENPYLTQGRIQFESHLTDEVIDIVRVDTERVGAGLLKVILTVRNKRKSNLFAEFRTTFLDERGHVLEQTNWEPIELNARTVSEYTCTSMSTKAADYQIIIRKPAKTSFEMP
ncbi:MAG: DUF1425 domain-containing protein [Phycisphaerae bacterium]|nr:DUF1425 domain-containing protein [Phycisphaerae bacterium]